MPHTMFRPVAVVLDIIRVERRPRYDIRQRGVLVKPVLFRCEYLLLVHVHAHIAPLIVAHEKPQLDETSGEVDGFAGGLLIRAALAGAICPVVSIERAKVPQEWVNRRIFVTIIVGHILAQSIKERQKITIEPWPVVTTDSRSRAQKIAVVKILIIQVLNVMVAGRKTVGGLKRWVILHKLRRINVRPLSDQLLERL